MYPYFGESLWSSTGPNDASDGSTNIEKKKEE
jgi:hypothetical protein